MFDRFEALASSAIDRVFGERVRIEPRADGELMRGGADLSRATAEITAVVDVSPELVTTKDGRTRAASPPLAADRIDVSFVTTSLPYTVKAGDRVVALAQSGAVLAVSAAADDGAGRTVLKCHPARP